MNKLNQKEAECIIFTYQDFWYGNTPIEIYALDLWCRITTDGARHLFFSDGPVEECLEMAEAEEMVEEVV